MAPAQNMQNFIDIIMSTNYGFHSFGKLPACHKANLHLGLFFGTLRFFVDLVNFFRFFTKKAPCLGRVQSKSIEPVVFCCGGGLRVLCFKSYFHDTPPLKKGYNQVEIVFIFLFVL